MLSIRSNSHAAALVLDEAWPGGLPFACSDSRLAAAAEAEGLRVVWALILSSRISWYHKIAPKALVDY